MELSAAAFVDHFNQYETEPVSEPVVVKSDGRVIGVFVSADDFTRLRRASRQVYRLEELPEHDIENMEAATYPSDEEIAAAGL